MSERMKNRDDSPYIWAALDGLDVADFGQLSPAKQSLVLMRAAQIQQTDGCSILPEGDYRDHRFLCFTEGMKERMRVAPLEGENAQEWERRTRG